MLFCAQELECHYRRERKELGNNHAFVAKADAPWSYVSPYWMATLRVGLGDKDEAMRWLDKALEERSGGLTGWASIQGWMDCVPIPVSQP